MASIEIKTGVDGGKLELVSFSGTEEFSQPFAYDLILSATQGALSREELLDKLIGQSATILMSRAAGESAYINGYLSEVHLTTSEHQLVTYRARLVPWLWFLSKKSDCRVYLDKTPIEIIKEVLDRAPIKGKVEYGDLDEAIYPKLDYCVQFRETDLNFVSRLMEQYGIFYCFEHSESSHRLILGDQTKAYRPAADAVVNFFESRSKTELRAPQLLSWQHGFRFVSGGYDQTDYDFEQPKLDQKAIIESSLGHGVAKPYRIFDAPGEYKTPSDGERWTKVRMQEVESVFDEVVGSSTCRSFAPGCTFQVGNVHPIATEIGKDYVITSVSHSAHESVLSGDSGLDYGNRFVAIPADKLFRPQRRTPKPIVSGLQSAVVVGDGQEVHADPYGRIKVQFHWDRYGQKNGASSFWIRVAQSVAGRGWGFHAIPRVGQEVVVEFEEGDPDRPIIVGSLYNADQKPYYDAERDPGKTAIRTHSMSSNDGFNELMFDDTPGAERVFIHAENGYDLRVKKDARQRIGHDLHTIVGEEGDGSRYELIHKDSELQIKGNRIEQVEGNVTLHVGGGNGGTLAMKMDKSLAVKVGSGGASREVDGDVIERVGGKQSLEVTGDQIGKCATWSHESKQTTEFKVGANFAVDAASEVHLKSGANVVIESGVSLSLKVGSNFISLTPAGIFIQGTLVGINSGGAAVAGMGVIGQSPASVPPEPLLDKDPKPPAEAHDEKTGYASI
ncbi:MAG TPA: type VI secretion system tip protein TssI/VgrG [Pirellulaceae bacterium]|nr:type VI secretion system tip protein TssI/VgrG [Pirellulaceae bacterium]